MDFQTLVLSAAGYSRLQADALLLVLTGEQLPPDTDASLAAALVDAVAGGDFEFKAGKQILLRQVGGIKPPRVLVAATGALAGKTPAKAVRAAVGQALAALKGLGVQHLAVHLLGLPALSEAEAEAVAVAAQDALYVYRHTKPSAAQPSRLNRLSLLTDDKAQQAQAQEGLRRGAAVAEGVWLARELANRPANHCTPTLLADEARKMARTQGLKIEVLDRRRIEALGMGSFLAVAQGSDEPPRFIVMHYQGAPATEAPLVLVGKGITFDTGGISIKPAAEMDEMKFDMGGAASVIGTLRAVAQLKPAINVVGIVAATENMPSGRAVKPGDVVTSMSGQTIEVLNTDAEGRLILCDALTYAERFKPRAVVDVATLTGACVIALGAVRSGLFSPDDGLAAELLSAGEAAQDPAWRMPLDEEYDEALKSNFADMGNVGGRAAGSVTAAMFLKRFAGKLRWAHLDIAGTAWKGGAAKGATGRPVGLLTRWVLDQAAAPAAPAAAPRRGRTAAGGSRAR